LLDTLTPTTHKQGRLAYRTAPACAAAGVNPATSAGNRRSSERASRRVLGPRRGACRRSTGPRRHQPWVAKPEPGLPREDVVDHHIGRAIERRAGRLSGASHPAANPSRFRCCAISGRGADHAAPSRALAGLSPAAAVVPGFAAPLRLTSGGHLPSGPDESGRRSGR
jgi:hypothetical protein